MSVWWINHIFFCNISFTTVLYFQYWIFTSIENVCLNCCSWRDNKFLNLVVSCFPWPFFCFKGVTWNNQIAWWKFQCRFSSLMTDRNNPSYCRSTESEIIYHIDVFSQWQFTKFWTISETTFRYFCYSIWNRLNECRIIIAILIHYWYLRQFLASIKSIGTNRNQCFRQWYCCYIWFSESIII